MFSKPQQSKNFPDSFFRVSIKGLYVKDGKILLLKESKEKGEMWELPGGGLEFGEDPQTGLKREILEETSLIVTNVSKNPIYAWQNKFENKRNLDWYHSLVVAYKIDLANLEFTPSQECVDIGFFSLEELPNLNLNVQTKGLLTHFNLEDFN